MNMFADLDFVIPVEIKYAQNILKMYIYVDNNNGNTIINHLAAVLAKRYAAVLGEDIIVGLDRGMI